MNSSSSSHLPTSVSRVNSSSTDQDYDFPAREDPEQEDYDEPCPVLPEAEPHEDQEDYDEPNPVLPLNCPSEKTEATESNTLPSLVTQEDYDEPQPILPKKNNLIIPVPQSHAAKQVENPECEPDYDEPALSHKMY